MPEDLPRWFAVRCVFDIDRPEGTPYLYEERMTLWRAADFEEAIELAITEAKNVYADADDVQYTGLAQAFELLDPPGHGAEIFSLMRASALKTNKYLDRFFDTGTELAGDVS